MSKARRRAPRGQSPPRRRVNAALHCHSSFATTLACHHRGIPGFHYMIVVAGGADIRCAPYATFGTQALSDVAVAALANRKACLLGQHGQIALGGTVKTALQLAVEGETLARMYVQALSLVHRARRKIHKLGLTCESGVWPRLFVSSQAPSTSNASSG